MLKPFRDVLEGLRETLLRVLERGYAAVAYVSAILLTYVVVCVLFTVFSLPPRGDLLETERELRHVLTHLFFLQELPFTPSG